MNEIAISRAAATAERPGLPVPYLKPGQGESHLLEKRAGRLSASKWLVVREELAKGNGDRAYRYCVYTPSGSAVKLDTEDALAVLQFLTTGAVHSERRFTRRDFPALLAAFYDANADRLFEEGQKELEDHLAHWYAGKRLRLQIRGSETRFQALLRVTFYAGLSRLVNEGRNLVADIRATVFPGYFFERLDFSCFARPLEDELEESWQREAANETANNVSLATANLAAIVRDVVSKRLWLHRGNLAQAAASLGITRRGLQKMLDRYRNGSQNRGEL